MLILLTTLSGLGAGAAEARVLARTMLRATMHAKLLKAIIFCNGRVDLVRVGASYGSGCSLPLNLGTAAVGVLVSSYSLKVFILRAHQHSVNLKGPRNLLQVVLKVN